MYKIYVNNEKLDTEKDFDKSSWEKLKEKYINGEVDIKLACECECKAILTQKRNYKKPENQTRYSAHPPNTQCEDCKNREKYESSHRENQWNIKKACENLGYENIEMEKSFVDEDNKLRKVDVYCEYHGKFGIMKIALEVQISPQERLEYYERTADYLNHDLKTIWFCNKKSMPNCVHDDVKCVILKNLIKSTAVSTEDWQPIIENSVRQIYFKYFAMRNVEENFLGVKADSDTSLDLINPYIDMSIDKTMSGNLIYRAEFKNMVTPLQSYYKPIFLEFYNVNGDIVNCIKTINEEGKSNLVYLSPVVLDYLVNLLELSNEGKELKRFIRECSKIYSKRIKYEKPIKLS